MAVFMHVRNRKTFKARRNIDDDNYKNLLRFEKRSVAYLTATFLPESDEMRGGAVTTQEKMEIFLRYLSDPGFQIGVGEDFGVHRTTVCKTFKYVLNVINGKASDYIHFPKTLQQIYNAKEKWAARFKFPNVIGALDCTHIEVKKPAAFGDCYINRKGYASINVQATCDADEKFTSINASWPGSTHDSRIWRCSGTFQVMKKLNGSACLLADSGYGLSPWVMTPFQGRLNAEQEIFNKQLAKERVVIERVFGQIKKRFPILGNLVRVKLDKVAKIVVACAVLHNIGKTINDNYEVEEIEILDEIENDEELQEADREVRRRGEEKRNEIMNVLLQNL